MKIISKFKDFYDYKVAKYGVDEKLVYNRVTKNFRNSPRLFSINKTQPDYNNKILFVGDKIVLIFKTEEKLYTQFDLKDIELLKSKNSNVQIKNFFHHTNDSEITFLDGNTIFVNSFINIDLYDLLKMNRKTFYNFFIKNKKDFFDIDEENNFFNEPIVLIEFLENVTDHDNRRSTSVYKKTYNPNLSQLGIYFDEDFVWQSLVEFLSNKRSEKEISPEVSNENKILSKGFDLKVAKYGMDEKLVYTRKTYCEYFLNFYSHLRKEYRFSEEEFNKNLKKNVEYSEIAKYHKILVIGEKVIHLFFTENGVYTHLDIKNRKDIERPYGCVESKTIIFNDDKKFDIFSAFPLLWPNLFSYDRNRLIRVNTDIPSDDIILNAPIFLIEYIGEYNDGTSRRQYFPPLYKFTYNPNLSQMGVYIDEDFIWQSLVEFLSNKRSEKEISPEVSNENKILSKGFDLKTSFRPNMKKKHKGDI